MRVSLVGLFQAAAVVTVVFSLVTLLPVDHYTIQLFTHFRLQYLAVSLLLLVVFLWLRSPWFAGALLVTVIANASLVLPWYFNKQDTGNGEELKVLHANVLSSNTEYDRLIDLVTTERPDIIVLQEVTPSWAKAIQPLRAAYPFEQVEAREGNFGIALLSRLPLSPVEAIDSSPFGYPTITAEVAVGDQSLRILTSHPTIPLGRSLYEARNEQLESLPNLLSSGSGATLLAGDLNSSQWDIHYQSLEQATGLRNARDGFGIVPTWPTFMPFAMIPIDHVLVSETIAVTDVRSGPRIGSDHLPLVVTISL